MTQKVIKIDGMTCGHCSARVEKVLNAISGVKATVSLDEKEAVVDLTEDVSDEVLTKTVEDAGYTVKRIL